MDIKIMWAALVFGEHNIEPENWKPIKDSLRGTTIISLLFWILLFYGFRFRRYVHCFRRLY